VDRLDAVGVNLFVEFLFNRFGAGASCREVSIIKFSVGGK
jgi:hypothetical protein